MARKIRSDCTVGSLEKRAGIFGALRNIGGRKTRKDCRVGTLRKRAK